MRKSIPWVFAFCASFALTALAEEPASLPLGGSAVPDVTGTKPDEPAVPEEEGSGIDEPNAPDALTTEKPVEEVATGPRRYGKLDYPIEVIHRPMTLAGGQGEVSLEIPYVHADGNPIVFEVLRASFGITSNIEAGLVYGIGGELLGSGVDKRFEVGKSVALGARVTIIPDLLGAELAVPLYFGSEFAASISAGVPLRYRFLGRFAVYGLHDVIDVRIKTMVVDPTNPIANAATMAGIATSMEPYSGNVNINVGAMAELQKNLTLAVETGFHFMDFAETDMVLPFYGILTWSKSNRFDIIGRLGLGDLNFAAETFTVGVTAALRL
jgi:hypothetical protein